MRFVAKNVGCNSNTRANTEMSATYAKELPGGLRAVTMSRTVEMWPNSRAHIALAQSYEKTSPDLSESRRIGVKVAASSHEGESSRN